MALATTPASASGSPQARKESIMNARMVAAGTRRVASDTLGTGLLSTEGTALTAMSNHEMRAVESGLRRQHEPRVPGERGEARHPVQIRLSRPEAPRSRLSLRLCP